MLLAFGAAAFARLDAGAQLGSGQFEISAGEARDDTRRGQADIGAIVAIANALHHLRHLLLAQTRVGAGVARFRARITSGDVFDVGRVI